MKDGSTALMMASSQGHMEIIKLLKLELKTQQVDGYAAIHFAAINKQLEAVKFLLNDEQNLKTKENATPLMLAAEKDWVEGVNILLGQAKTQRQDGITALMLAAIKGFVGCV